MADNPRLPEHHSDIPSSRHSEGMPNPASPSPGSGYSPPATPQSNVSPGKTHIRNLILGAVVTIISSTVVFIITQYLKKPEGNEFERKKDASIAAWKSYEGYENAYAKNTLTYQRTAQLEGRDAYLKAMKAESEKFQKDIQDLQKRKNLDEDLIKAFSKRIENEKATFPLIEEFNNNLARIEAGNLSIKEKKDKFIYEMLRWSNLTKGLYERAVNDIKEIGKVLADRYGGSFSMDNFVIIQKAPQMMRETDSLIQVYQNVIIDSSGNIIENRNFVSNINPDNLVGKWTVEGAVITLAKDGTMFWLVSNGSKALGTWKVVKDKLKMQATTTPGNNKVQWSFNVANISINSFTMILDTAPYNLYKLTRTLEN